jgi:hypothetical protein
MVAHSKVVSLTYLQYTYLLTVHYRTMCDPTPLRPLQPLGNQGRGATMCAHQSENGSSDGLLVGIISLQRLLGGHFCAEKGNETALLYRTRPACPGNVISRTPVLQLSPHVREAPDPALSLPSVSRVDLYIFVSALSLQYLCFHLQRSICVDPFPHWHANPT